MVVGAIYSWHFEAVWRNLPFLLLGARTTMYVTLLSLLFGLAIGLMAALLRLSPVRPFTLLAAFYIDLFRSTPLLVQLVWAFYALPILVGHGIPPLVAGVGVLSLYVGSYLAEIFRAGIQSIARGQRDASLALGMTGSQVMVRIVLPQAAVRMLPPIASTAISLVKDSSLVSVISVAELIFNAQSLSAVTLRPVEVLTGAALMYFVLAYPFSLLAGFLHQRFLTV
jgi:polar amino acid transport system permease protein